MLELDRSLGGEGVDLPDRGELAIGRVGGRVESPAIYSIVYHNTSKRLIVYTVPLY